MPEGPEIRLAADAVASVLVGREIVQAKFDFRRLAKFEKPLTGSKVVAVDTRGKAMLTRFDNGLTLYSHNQLYGRWYTMRRPRMPKTSRLLRVALHTKNSSALLYSASDIEVLTEKQLSLHPFLQRAGPDILDPGLSSGKIVERLESPQFRNRAFAGLYLDQSFLAGNGNYLRSEILWAAGINPATRPAALGRAELVSLAKETLRISRRSYRTRGVTVTPGLARSLKAKGLKYGEYRFSVFDRAGLPCYRCGTVIARQAMAGRSAFLCPSCQPHCVAQNKIKKPRR